MEQNERKENASKLFLIKEYFKKKCLVRPPIDTDPRLIPDRKKSLIVACISLITCTGGFSSTIYFPGLPYITNELHAPEIATTLTASLFILFTGLTPMIWASISEYYHIRRFIFLVAMTIFSAASLGGAFVHNIWAMVVVRCIQSIGVSSGQSVGAGYIADMYPIEKRGAAFGKYIFGAIFGPLLGPIIGGGLIMSPLTWRATFWFCFSFGIFIFLVTFFYTPETFRDNARFDVELPTATTRPDNESSETTSNNEKQIEIKGIDTAKTTVDIHEDEATSEKTMAVNNDKSDVSIISEPPKKAFNPFLPFGLLRHPFILMSAITGGFFFGSMFATEAILPNAFSKVYGLNSWQVGLSYLGAGVGNLMGSFVGARLSDRLLLRSRRLRGGKHLAEDRLTFNIWIAGFFFNPIGCLIFGWVVEKKKSFWVAIIGFGIQCFGNVQVMTSTTAYLVDAMPGRSASASAATNVLRSGFACILSLISTPMVANLGPGWTSTLFACLSLVGMGLMLTLKIWGERIRAYSGY